MSFNTNRSRKEVKAILRSIPSAIKGGPDPLGLGEAYRSAFAYSLLTSVYEAYLIKSLGGTDDLGNSWPPLEPETKAYHRKELRSTLNLPGNKRRPTLSPEQDAVWRGIFVSKMEPDTDARTPRTPKRLSDRARLSSRRGTLGAVSRVVVKGLRSLGIRKFNDYNAFQAYISQEEAEARADAAAKAWAYVKARLGATTLLELLGGVECPIMVDSGRLLASYDPGLERIPYKPPNPETLLSFDSGHLKINSRVEYKPSKDSKRPVIPHDITPWIEKAKKHAEKKLVERLREVL